MGPPRPPSKEAEAAEEKRFEPRSGGTQSHAPSPWGGLRTFPSWLFVSIVPVQEKVQGCSGWGLRQGPMLGGGDLECGVSTT